MAVVASRVYLVMMTVNSVYLETTQQAGVLDAQQFMSLENARWHTQNISFLLRDIYSRKYS